MKKTFCSKTDFFNLRGIICTVLDSTSSSQALPLSVPSSLSPRDKETDVKWILLFLWKYLPPPAGSALPCLRRSSSCLLCLSHSDLGCAAAVNQGRWMFESRLTIHQTRNPESSYRLFWEHFLR